VGDGGIAVLGATQQEACVELDRIGAAVDCDDRPQTSRVDAKDSAAVAVVNAGAEIVAPDDYAIARREPAAEQGQLVGFERTGRDHPLTGEAVELGDVATGAGDHERSIEIAG
jgi:hypothetical protein